MNETKKTDERFDRKVCREVGGTDLGPQRQDDDENKKRKRVLIVAAVLAILLITILLLMRSCHTEPTEPDDPKLPVQSGSEWDGSFPEPEVSVMEDSIEIPGYSVVVITEDSPTMILGNPTGNTVFFQYIISDSEGKELFNTDLIKPGEMVEWNVKDDLPPGEYQVSMQIKTYDLNTQEACNGAKQTPTIKVQ